MLFAVSFKLILKLMSSTYEIWWNIKSEEDCEKVEQMMLENIF